MEEEEEQEKNYGLNIRRHSSHSRSFPWLALLKIVIGIGIILFTWYVAKSMFEKPAAQPDPPEIRDTAD